MHFVFSALTVLLAATSAPNIKVQEVADEANLPILNPDLSKRRTGKLLLQNGMEVYLISDPGADKSSAMLSVDVGSWNDPEKYPGMAHFCEHMLFMGTEKYPNENEFFTLIYDNDGIANAFTAPNKTAYMFSSQSKSFLMMLDRFAHFFIDPLFNPNGIARELHSVDQEFSKNIENDNWREYQIFKEMGNPEHPNRGFSTGNSQTLGRIPQSALKNWYQKHYSADRMHLAIYSSLPLDELREAVVEIFPGVPVSADEVKIPNIPLTSDQQRGKITYIVPVQDIQKLSLSWELPADLSADSSKSAELVAYALKRGSYYSLHQKLKREHLVDSVSIVVDDMGGKEHRFFQFSAELTEKGMENIDLVVERFYQALATMKKEGVPKYLLEEKNAIAKLGYQFQGRSDPFMFAYEMAESFGEEPLATYPRGKVLSTEYNTRKIKDVLALLTPQSCLINVMASPQLTQVFPEKKEQWMKAEYAVRPIPSDWQARWYRAAPHPDIRLAQPNPYVPKDLNIVRASTDPKTPVPLLLSQSEYGEAFYTRSSEFNVPKAVYHVHVLSPLLDGTPRSAVLADLYLDHFTDTIYPDLSAANKAGMAAKFNFDRSRIHFQINGFSDKAPLLLQTILQNLSVAPPTKEQFAIYQARWEKEYANSQKQLAVFQAKELSDGLINPEKVTSMEKLDVLPTIGYDEFSDFCNHLYDETYVEALFSGNLSLKQADSAWLDIQHILGRSPFPKELHPQTKVLSLPQASGPYVVRQTTEALGNATMLVLDEGAFTFERRAAQEILGTVLKEAFFSELRTKQNTGYIAKAQDAEIEKHLYQFFFVQSNSHQPEDLLYRFELFLERFSHDLSFTISPERFEALRASQINSLQTRFRNLTDKTALWNLLAFETDADFAFVDKRIDGLNNLSYEKFISLSQDYLSRNNRKRLAILFEGKMQQPFTYESIDAMELSDIGQYITRFEQQSLNVLEKASSRN